MSIDLCYETAVGKLTVQGEIVPISKKLLTLNTNHERVLFVAEILRDLALYPNIDDVAKSDNVCTYYRNHGNKCFQKSENYEAWQYYNLSLLHAPLNSDNYTLAIANRSAVLFSLKKYEECMQDIQGVFSLKYPEKIKDKLMKRKAQCQEFLDKCKCQKKVKENMEIEEIENILTFKGTKDEKFLCASKKLEVIFSEEMGRHVVAKEDIKAGEILAEEEPYFTLLLKSQCLFTCSYCLSRKLNLMPCDSCCFALYCSMLCKENAWKDYHKIECRLMPTLVKMEFTKLELLALRTVIKARTDHSGWSDLFDTIKLAERNINTELHGQVKVNDKWVYDSKYYTSIHTLASNIDKRSVSDIFQKSVTAAVFLYLLKEKTDFLNCLDKENKGDIIKCVSGTLLHHIMTAPTNMHGIRSNIQTPDGNFVEEVNLASAPYAFLSLLNHACAPNVVRFSKLGTGRMTLFALRPVKKGMQLFDNYGSHHALEDRRSRHEQLKFQYKFDCLCEACINNWPTYLRLRPAKMPARISNLKELLLNMDVIEKLQKGDIATALKLFQPLCNLAEALDPYAPCTELADCQESLKQCLAIFEGFVPYGYSKLIEWPPLPPKV